MIKLINNEYGVMKGVIKNSGQLRARAAMRVILGLS